MSEIENEVFSNKKGDWSNRFSPRIVNVRHPNDKTVKILIGDGNLTEQEEISNAVASFNDEQSSREVS